MDKAIDQNNFLYFISVITTQNVGRTLEELVSSCFFMLANSIIQVLRECCVIIKNRCLTNQNWR